MKIGRWQSLYEISDENTQFQHLGSTQSWINDMINNLFLETLHVCFDFE